MLLFPCDTFPEIKWLTYRIWISVGFYTFLPCLLKSCANVHSPELRLQHALLLAFAAEACFLKTSVFKEKQNKTSFAFSWLLVILIFINQFYLFFGKVFIWGLSVFIIYFNTSLYIKNTNHHICCDFPPFVYFWILFSTEV